MRARRATSTAILSASALCCALGCGAPPVKPPGPRQIPGVPSMPEGAVGNVEVRTLVGRPRLTLVSREGDPVTALVAAIAVDEGPVAATALGAILEARLRAAGHDAELRTDRSSVRLGFVGVDAARAPMLLEALAAAMHRAVAPGSPEVAAAATRLTTLRRHPLDGPELVPVVACTGKLGVPAAQPVLEVGTAAGAQELEAWRRSALTIGRTSIAAVGPAPFCVAVAKALGQTAGWDPGAPSQDPAPLEDTASVYAPPAIALRSSRVTVAVRVGDAAGAVAAATRLGEPDSPLVARLAALPQPFRATEVVGIARPRGGCVSVTIETADQPDAVPIERTAAAAAALVREEIRLELMAPRDPAVATRQILGAGDPREAGARAAWWALAGNAPSLPDRTATVLAIPSPSRPGGGPRLEDVKLAFPIELGRALAAKPAAVERTAAVERGQGELWVLLASPCGVADEGSEDAGATALAAIAAVGSRRRGLDVAIEPWVTPDGVGVVAHGAARGGETAVELATRVADAAARTLVGTTISPEALAAARALSLEHLERAHGRDAAALEVFAGAIAPEHPSWLEPFGVWSRVVGGGLEAVRLRWQALGLGPMRLTVLANGDGSEVSAAEAAVNRWLPPRVTSRSCAPASPLAGRAGRFDVRLTRDAGVAQAVVGAAVSPRGASGWSLAELTAVALDGRDGLVEKALRDAQIAARARVSLEGGSRAAALLIDVRAPADALEPAVTELKALLARLGQSGPTEADLTRAAATLVVRERDARLDPRTRLVDLWSGRTRGIPARPALGAWRDWIASTFRDASLVVVEAKPE